MVFGFKERKEPSCQPGFWNAELLAARGDEVISPFCEDTIKYGSYELKMGPEVYVSPSDGSRDSTAQTIRNLAPDEAFTIPPGQFVFLLSEEKVCIPDDAIAWISMRAKAKWKGLINVSGFHVDPGFKGRLIFAVYNAGPVVVHLRRGEKLFLIWFSSLVAPTKFVRNEPVQEHIPASLISGIGGELQSLANLNTKIREVDTALRNRVHDVEKEMSVIKTSAAIAITLLLAVGGYLIRSNSTPNPPQLPSTPHATDMIEHGGVFALPVETIPEISIVPSGAKPVGEQQSRQDNGETPH